MESTNESVISTISEDSKAVHLLFIGKTGAGKTTLINAFVNHFYNKGFNEEPEILIPRSETQRCSFPEYEHLRDSREYIKKNSGKSQTQKANSYVLSCNGRTLRIIDTPGLLDTDGFQKDKENIEKIIEGIKSDGYVQAIILVIDAECRTMPGLAYYIDEIKKVLTKSIMKQTMVVCTKSAGEDQNVMKLFNLNFEEEARISRERWFFINNKWLTEGKKDKASEICWKKSKKAFESVYVQVSEFDRISTNEMNDLFEKRRQIETELSRMILSIQTHKLLRDEKVKEFKNSQRLTEETERFIQAESKQRRSIVTKHRNFNCQACNKTCIENSSKFGEFYFKWISERGICKHCECPRNKHVFENVWRFVGLDEEAKTKIVDKLKVMILNRSVEDFHEALMSDFREIIKGKIEGIAKTTAHVERLGIMPVNYDSFLNYLDSSIEALEKDFDLSPEERREKKDILELERRKYLEFKEYYSKTKEEIFEIFHND